MTGYTQEKLNKVISNMKIKHKDFQNLMSIMIDLVRMNRIPVDISEEKAVALAYKFAKKVKKRLIDDTYKHILSLKRIDN